MNTTSTTSTTSTSTTTPAAAAIPAATHRFAPWKSGLPIDESKGRAVILTFRAAASGPNKGKKSHEDCYIQVPDYITADSIKAEIDSLAPAIVELFQQAEKNLLTDEYKKDAKGYSSSWFTLAKLAQYIEENATSARLSKEDIEAWFKLIQDELTSVIATRLFGEVPVEELNEEQLTAALTAADAYKDMFTPLAVNTTKYDPAQCDKLLRIFEVCENANDRIGSQLKSKLERIKANAPKVTILDL